MCSSPMGSFEITDTPWEESIGEDYSSEIIDAWGSFCEPGGRLEETGRSPMGWDSLRRHEFYGRTAYGEGEMESGMADPSGGLRLPEEYPRTLLRCDSPVWDVEDLYDEPQPQRNVDGL